MFDDADSLLVLMRDTALHAALLAQGAAPPPAHVWRARCVALVERLRQALLDAGYSLAGIDEVSLSQCVLLDELTLRVLPAGAGREWLRERLQARFHGTNDGAARVWARIDALLRDERRDGAALAWYGLMLALGFEGGRARPDVYRRRVLGALERRGVAAVPPPPRVPMPFVPPPAELTMPPAPAAPQPLPARRRAAGRNWLAPVVIVAAFAVVAAALWVAFDARLSMALDRLSSHDGVAAARHPEGGGS